MHFDSRAPGAWGHGGSAVRALAACWIVTWGLACALPFGTHPPPETRATRALHGIEITVAVRGGEAEAVTAAIGAAFAAAEEIGGRLLAGVRGSEIDILVHVPSHVWVEISPTVHAALVEAFEIAEATEGAYDPTWPPLLKVWGLSEEREPRVPRDFEIDTALRRVDWENIEIMDEEGLQARRLSRRTQIRLGGLARGAMLDEAVAQLRLAGMTAGRADTREEHAVFGGTRAHPFHVRLPSGQLSLREGAVAAAARPPLVETADGQSIHEHFDPRSGRPAEGSLWAAVAGQRASTSAAYADAVFAMGREGSAFVEERAELLAVIQGDQGGDTPWVSPGLDYRAD